MRLLLRIRDVQIPGGIDGDACSDYATARWWRAVVPAVALSPVSRDCGDHPVRDLANAIVAGIRNVQIPGGIDGDASGVTQLRAGGRAVVPAVARSPVSRDCGDHPVRDLANAIVAAYPRCTDSRRNRQRRLLGRFNCALGGRAVVPAVASSSVSRDCGDHPVRDLANATVRSIRDVQISGGIDGDACRLTQLRAGGRAVVPAVPLSPVSRDGRDHPVRDLANAKVAHPQCTDSRRNRRRRQPDHSIAHWWQDRCPRCSLESRFPRRW